MKATKRSHSLASDAGVTSPPARRTCMLTLTAAMAGCGPATPALLPAHGELRPGAREVARTQRPGGARGGQHRQGQQGSGRHPTERTESPTFPAPNEPMTDTRPHGLFLLEPSTGSMNVRAPAFAGSGR